MRKNYDNKATKSCTTLSFPSYREDEIQFNKKRADMFDRVINSLNENTATRKHKNCPYKISPLISF